MAEHIMLKWGNLKGWKVETDTSRAALKAFFESGDSASAWMAMVRLGSEEKEALCGLIDAIGGEIQNDWTGEIMTKDAAKQYVREYSA